MTANPGGLRAELGQGGSTPPASTEETPTYSLLWYTDRSRYTDENRCKRLRFLHNHYGPLGVGLDRLAKSVPLATGGSVHEGLRPILQYVAREDVLPPQAVVDSGVIRGLKDYTNLVDSRGLNYWDDTPEATLRLITEQKLLIEGLVRGWTAWRLPDIWRTYRVVHVEEERIKVRDCSCGLGDGIGAAEDHNARGCQGIGFMTRADFVAQHRISSLYAYNEFKTCAEAGRRWKEQWETDMQPYLGTLGLEAELGIQIEEIFIHALMKGKLDHEYDPATKTYTGPEYQNSPLCYAYFNTSSPELQEWAVRYKWWDTVENRERRLPNYFKRRPLSEFGPLADYFATFGEELADKVTYVHGPLLRKDAVRQEAEEGWLHSERRWRWIVWELQEALEQVEGRLDPPHIQALLHEHAPCSFECQPFGTKYQCIFVPVCHKHPGWEQPDLLGYVPRRPHHTPELKQLEDRGYSLERLPVDGLAEE